MTKSLDDNFVDWEAHVFGFGYGSGEPHTLAMLKAFFQHVGTQPDFRGYDYRELEETLSPPVTWLLINTLCHADVIEYGSSPRHGWLTEKGERLKAFVDKRNVGELCKLCCEHDDGYIHCYPNACNCGPNGHEPGRVCKNPFWQ